MKTSLRSRLADIAISMLSLAVLAVVFTSCKEEDGAWSIGTPERGVQLTALTDISGDYYNGSHSGPLGSIVLTLMRSSDNKFWNGTSWGASFNLPTTFGGNVWQLAPGVVLPSGPNLQDDYYLIEAIGNFTEVKRDAVFFTVGNPAPPIVPTPWSWGRNLNGQLGVGNLTNASTPVPVFMRGALEGKIVTGLAAGGKHTLALTSEGVLYAWGRNGEGQLGSTAPPDDPNNDQNNLIAVKVDTTGVLSGKRIAAMAAGSDHSLAVSSDDGKVFAWGINTEGQLGNNTFGSGTASGVPVEVIATGALSNKRIIAVSAGGDHSVALSDAADSGAGKLFAWGANTSGQLGDGTSASRRTEPVAVTGLSGKSITAVDCGISHNLALTDEGKVYAWGAGANGRLGNGGTADSNVPVLISGPWGTRKIVAISAGRSHSLAADEDGKVYAWGSDSEGQIGTSGGSADQLVPVQVGEGAFLAQDVVDVHAGGDFSVAVTRDNVVWTWGDPGEGQLGRSVSFNNVPGVADMSAALLGGRAVLDLSAGENHVEMLAGFPVQPTSEIEVEAQGTELASGDTINCGSFGVGTSNPIFITIRNRGTSDLTGLSVSFFGADYHAFSTQQTVAPNGETGFQLFFSPNSTGVLTSSVQIPSNDADENPFIINLTGTGTPMGQVDLAFDPGVLGEVFSTSVQPDGKAVIGGTFVQVNGPGGPARNYMARVDGSTGVADSFDPNLSAFSFNNCSAVLPDGKVMIGGSFTTVGGVARNRLARLNPGGTLDLAFDAQIPFSGTVHAMALQGDGKLLVTGNFTNIGGSGQQYLARLNTDDTVDTVFAPVLNGSGRGVAVQPDGNVIVCGAFTTANGQGFARLVRLSGVDGSLDPGFTNPNIVTKFGSDIDCVAVQPDGKILVGGNLQSVDGTTRNGMCRLNANGTLDSFFDPDVNGRVTSIVVQANERILIGGEFTEVGGQPRNRLALLHPGGSLEFFFDPAPNNAVRGVTLQADGKVLAAGAFTGIGGQVRSNLARLSNDAATQSLYVDNGEIIWERGGSSPETNLVTFDVSSDGGTSWTPLGAATGQTFPMRHWSMFGATLPATGHIRARAYPQGGYYNGSVSLLQTISAYGEPPEITVTENSAPVLTSAIREFGVVGTGSNSAVMQLTIQNTGGSPLTGLSGTVLVDNDLFDGVDHRSHFLLVRPAASTLAPGASTTMSVTYRPKTKGRHTAVARITSNDGDEFFFDITVTGLGSEPITTHRQIKHGDTINAGAAADTADTNFNGQSELQEYATGTDAVPTMGDGTSVTPPDNGGGFAAEGGGAEGESPPPTGGTFLFNYQRNKLSMADVTFQVEWSDTLATNDWHTTDVTEVVLTDDDHIQQVQATVPAGTAGRRFVRLKITRP